MVGDNWIASLVSAVESNPDEWNSTAIFITYDDCGCFYDHVLPPKGMGIRLPMVIVSPYAKPHFVDSNGRRSRRSSLHRAPVRPQAAQPVDGNAYDYFDSFDFGQRPLPPIPLPQHAVPRSSLRFVRGIRRTRTIPPSLVLDRRPGSPRSRTPAPVW